MGKIVDTSMLDASRVIGEGKPGNRKPQSPEQVKEPVREETPKREDEIKIPVAEPKSEVQEMPRRKRTQPQATNYKETFVVRNEMKTRQCVYISHRVHAVIAKLVRALVDSGNDVTVGGYIDTVLDEHLQLHKEEINEVYRRDREDLL